MRPLLNPSGVSAAMQLEKRVMRNGLALAVLAVWVLMPATASAQMKNFAQNQPQNLPGKGATKTQAPPPAQLQPAAVAAQQAPLPRPEDMLGLIRTTIIALNQANQTGNYTVLRDLCAPDFRNGNDASRLGLIFQVLREQAIDLTPLLQIPPEVTETPAITQQGLLRLAGFFPTQPLRVNFDLSFQMSENRWRPYTISVYMARVEAELKAPALTVQSPPRPKK